MRTYEETLNYLYTQLPMFQRVGPVAFKKDLGNIVALLNYLGHPEQQFPSIHIAGTNGKGSVTHLVAAGLKATGKKVGIYTSPHYVDFRERIKIGAECIRPESVVAFVERIQEAMAEIKPSFFEITVAMAFQYFADQKVDIAVIETGLGGRLDSTNVLRPELCIITNIGLDHQQFLGDTLPLIAGEKAGIIKPNTPVVIGRKQAETWPVFTQKAATEGAPLFWSGDLVEVQQLEERTHGSLWRWKTPEMDGWQEVALDLNGPFLAENLQTSLAALWQYAQLEPFDVSRALSGWQQVREGVLYLGRWHWWSKEPAILLDSAHNEDGLRVLFERLPSIQYKELHLVFGTVADKDPQAVFPYLPRAANYYFTQAAVPRAMPASQLEDLAAEYGFFGQTDATVQASFERARTSMGSNDLLLVCGSIFVVAEVLAIDPLVSSHPK
ncbi:MAG: folylpolyglutamate synthase/dihydrofolate synthase family protein [Bacteroidota bacterium]